MYYFKATVKTLKIKKSNSANLYIAIFSYDESFKGHDGKKYGVAYENQNVTDKLAENQEFFADKEIFDFLCLIKDEKLLIGFDKDTFELKEVSLEND